MLKITKTITATRINFNSEHFTINLDYK